eukprot:49635_1
MDVSHHKDTNSVQQIQACSPLTMRDYSPSPSTTNNDNSSTTNTTNNTSNRTPTPNRTPNPIPTLPANSNIIKLEPHLTFQPLLTTINRNINSINKENHRLPLHTNIPRIPLPNMMPTGALSLPPLPSDVLSSHTGSNRKNTQSQRTRRRPQPIPIKMEGIVDPYSVSMRTRSRSRSARLNSASTSPPTSGSIPSELIAAFNHNLKVKKEHCKSDVVLDTSFDSCYIFSMRCPYTDCCKLFVDMSSYQAHHIECHQQRDKKGKLIQSKEAKWKCPDCGKISASWYNYAAHVTMHKDSCDAPWICKLPPVNKKKYIQWTDGTFICGKRCSTKHNLIKHLKALHTNHRIIDLSQSVKAQSVHKRNKENGYYGRRRSPRKRKKRPRFFNKSSTISPSSIHPPPYKKIKMDPDAMRSSSTALPIFQTQNTRDNWSINKKGEHKSVRQQSDFVGLLLEAAQLIETEDKTPSDAQKTTEQTNHNDNCVTSLQNVDALLSSIKTLFHSTAQSLASPNSMDNLTQLSAVLALGAAGAGSLDLVKDADDAKAATINISNMTDIMNVSIPDGPTPNPNYAQPRHLMPDIAITPNLPSLAMKLSPITASNPAICLPQMPLPPPPPQQQKNNGSENGNVQCLLKLLNYPSTQHSPNHIMVNNNTFNMFHPYSSIPLIPNVTTPLNVAKKNEVITNNILASLPPIHMQNEA